MAVIEQPLTLPAKEFESDQKPHRANLKSLEEFALSIFPQLVPVGAIVLYAGAIAPAGWLFCTGAELSRLEYSQLFAIIGTFYGDGNGSSTFNIPNFTAGGSSDLRVPAGVGTGASLGATQQLATSGAGHDAVIVNFIIKT